MRVAHFYHVYCDGHWQAPVSEHLAALEAAGYDQALFVGLVGSDEARRGVQEEFARARPVDGYIQSTAGWEQITLNALREYALTHAGAVMYAHTKGAAFPSRFSDVWRRSMTRDLLLGWKRCLDLLEAGLDAIGPHWLSPDEYPDYTFSPVFGGNFWIATTAYLRELPPCPATARHEAENWLGQRNPKVHDLHPGWPDEFIDSETGEVVSPDIEPWGRLTLRLQAIAGRLRP